MDPAFAFWGFIMTDVYSNVDLFLPPSLDSYRALSILSKAFWKSSPGLISVTPTEQVMCMMFGNS